MTEPQELPRPYHRIYAKINGHLDAVKELSENGELSKDEEKRLVDELWQVTTFTSKYLSVYPAARGKSIKQAIKYFGRHFKSLPPYLEEGEGGEFKALHVCTGQAAALLTLLREKLGSDERLGLLVMPEHVAATFTAAGKTYVLDDNLLHPVELGAYKRELVKAAKSDVHPLSDVASWLKKAREPRKVAEKSVLHLKPGAIESQVRYNLSGDYFTPNVIKKSTDLREARKHLEGALKSCGEDPYIHELLGQLNIAAGRRVEAVKNFARALKINPYVVGAWKGLGRLHLDAGKPKKAVTAFLKAHQIDGKDEETLFGLGKAFEAMAKIEGEPGKAELMQRTAERYYRRALPPKKPEAA